MALSPLLDRGGFSGRTTFAESHFVEFDRVQKGRRSIALCGDWCDERDISAEPTCHLCRVALAQTADDLFGKKEIW